MKTELVWEGKYDEYGNPGELYIARCALPGCCGSPPVHLQVNAKNLAIASSGDDMVASERASEYFKAPEL